MPFGTCWCLRLVSLPPLLRPSQRVGPLHRQSAAHSHAHIHPPIHIHTNTHTHTHTHTQIQKRGMKRKHYQRASPTKLPFSAGSSCGGPSRSSSPEPVATRPQWPPPWLSSASLPAPPKPLKTHSFLSGPTTPYCVLSKPRLLVVVETSIRAWGAAVGPTRVAV